MKAVFGICIVPQQLSAHFNSAKKQLCRSSLGWERLNWVQTAGYMLGSIAKVGNESGK